MGVAALCGNGVIDGIEKCDDGNQISGDGCDSRCCQELPFICYPIPPSPCFCGDGKVDPGESCDDGNTENGDGCDYDCRWGPRGTCGNGVLDPGEQCDDGNEDPSDGCYPWCRLNACVVPGTTVPTGIALCGNGIVEPGEECDDGNNAGGYGLCGPDCRFGPYCGDGVVQDAEECDDGNRSCCDGCSSTCRVEM